MSKITKPNYTDVFSSGSVLELLFNGTIDELRISDVARYTSNYTPQTAPF